MPGRCPTATEITTTLTLAGLLVWAARSGAVGHDTTAVAMAMVMVMVLVVARILKC